MRMSYVLNMENLQTSNDTSALEWAEIAGLVQIHANGSWQITELARDWFDKHPPTNPQEPKPSAHRSAASATVERRGAGAILNR